MLNIRQMDKGEIALRLVAIVTGVFFMVVTFYAPFVLYFGEPGAEALIFACIPGGLMLYLGVRR